MSAGNVDVAAGIVAGGSVVVVDVSGTVDVVVSGNVVVVVVDVVVSGNVVVVVVVVLVVFVDVVVVVGTGTSIVAVTVKVRGTPPVTNRCAPYGSGPAGLPR